MNTVECLNKACIVCADVLLEYMAFDIVRIQLKGTPDHVKATAIVTNTEQGSDQTVYGWPMRFVTFEALGIVKKMGVLLKQRMNKYSQEEEEKKM